MNVPMELVTELPVPPLLPKRASPDNGRNRLPVIGRFVAGPEHLLVCTVVDRLLRHEPPVYNPVVFFGAEGTGKTHLTAGIAAAWRGSRAAQSAIYVDAQSFCRQLCEVIRMKTTDDFCRRYRAVQLLCVDNVEQLARHSEAQRQLTATIDVLLARGGQLVFSAASHPAGLSDLHPSLRSRMAAGLAVELPLPSLATRITALRRLAESFGLAFEQHAAERLAERLDVPVPVLAQVVVELRRLLGSGIVITELLVRRYLEQRQSVRSVTVERIARATARRFNVPLAVLRGTSRSRSVVTARQIAIWLASRLTNTSFRRLGRYFGGRDHTTISHGYCKAEATVAAEPAMRRLVDEIRQQVLRRPQSTRQLPGDKASVRRRRRVYRREKSNTRPRGD